MYVGITEKHFYVSLLVYADVGVGARTLIYFRVSLMLFGDEVHISILGLEH